tara:strand:- start:332 stop:544 length:213 start_codon:yes stop_codon:yes gene_type:complete
MSSTHSFIGLLVCASLWLWIGWREKKRQLGTVSLFSPHLVQFMLLIIFFVFAAQFFSQVTGITWTPPFRR